jgi:hypothetical protein
LECLSWILVWKWWNGFTWHVGWNRYLKKSFKMISRHSLYWLGHPRMGTTLLHSLLAQDTESR